MPDFNRYTRQIKRNLLRELLADLSGLRNREDISRSASARGVVALLEARLVDRIAYLDKEEHDNAD